MIFTCSAAILSLTPTPFSDSDYQSCSIWLSVTFTPFNSPWLSDSWISLILTYLYTHSLLVTQNATNSLSLSLSLNYPTPTHSHRIWFSVTSNLIYPHLLWLLTFFLFCSMELDSFRWMWDVLVIIVHVSWLPNDFQISM